MHAVKNRWKPTSMARKSKIYSILKRNRRIIITMAFVSFETPWNSSFWANINGLVNDVIAYVWTGSIRTGRRKIQDEFGQSFTLEKFVRERNLTMNDYEDDISSFPDSRIHTNWYYKSHRLLLSHSLCVTQAILDKMPFF